jgi:hypothetical protein
MVCCSAQADCLPDPSSVFLFLEDHNIGRDHALFYEAYAAYLELKGNFNQADLVYQEGVKRCACAGKQWLGASLGGTGASCCTP